MTVRMDFRLLGPLAVWRDGMAIRVQQPKQRVVLATLLLRAGQVVATTELAEALWETPPPSATVTIRNYVKRLRLTLADESATQIRTQPGGYLINLSAGQLDLARFEAGLRAAQAASRDGRWEVAAAEAASALALWRGEPLADVDSGLLARREVPRLTELRWQALETRLEADVQLGANDDVIPELQALVAGQPQRASLHGQLMLALYRSGRLAEALAVYQDAQQALGTGPVQAADGRLAELREQILASGAIQEAVDPPSAPAGPELPPAAEDAGTQVGQPRAGTHPPAIPRQLPGPVRHFAGRAAELDALDELAASAGSGTSGTMVISAIGGTAGVGKTALAVHWAHLVSGQFPDGQLYLNLRGYDEGRPVPAADALAVFLRALGMPAQDLPADTDERAAQYRSLLAGRRILVVLDNASDVTQVRPLLPGSPTCFTLVTSRDSLAGLVARDGAQRLEVTLLPPADAVGLLRTLIGDRVTADPSAAATMARQCCGLPLALRIAAEIASARPGIPLAGLSAELADLGQRLDQLEVPGDERTAVRAVFSWSVRHLDADGAWAFRLAGLHPGRDLDQYTMAALAGVPLAAARRLLDQLARAYLLQPTGLGRYGQHDLLRGYARELAGQHESDLDRQAALTRLFDYYLAATAAASGMLFPSQRHRLPRLPEPGPLPPLDDAATARAWLDEHRPGLVLVAGYLAEHNWPSHVTRLAVILYSYLIRGGYYTEAIAINGHALRAAGRHGDQSGAAVARQGLGAAALQQGRFAEATDQLRQAAVLYHGQGDQLGEAYALSNLGLIDLQLGHEAQGADHYHQALELARQGGDRNCEGRVLGKLGYIARQHGRYGAATELYQQAVTLAQQVEDPHGEAEALSGLGPVELKQGHEQLAAGYQRKALALYREIGDRNGTAMALVRLGNAEMRGDRCDQADAVLQQALGLYRELGDRYGVAEALALLGLNAIRQQRHAAAAGLLRQAVTLFRETGDRSGEAQALNGLGAVFLAYGQPGRACRQHSAALTLAGQAGDQDREAQAYEGLARAYQAAGNAEEARRSWQEALWRYAELGLPEAEQVRAQLVSAGTPSPA